MGGNNYRIYKANTSDKLIQQTIIEVDEEAFGGTAGKKASPELGDWWIVVDNGCVVGYAGICPSWQWENAGYLCRAGVLASHRGQGLQRKLIQKRINWAKKLGWKWVVTDTTENMHSSNNLIACGFKLYQPKNPWAYEHSLYWIKEL